MSHTPACLLCTMEEMPFYQCLLSMAAASVVVALGIHVQTRYPLLGATS